MDFTNTMHWRGIIRLLVGCACVIPMYIMYILKIPVARSVGLYGIMIMVYYGVQWIQAYANYARINQLSLTDRGTTGVVVVGYREDLEYFRRCLLSVKELEDVSYLIVVIDGNEIEDLEMTNIFFQVFPQQLIHYEPNIPLQLTFNVPIVCVNQMHMGKRSALYTGIKYLLDKVDSILLMDSDTIISFDAILHLKTALTLPNAGAVTGQVGIFNIKNALTLMSRLRYWFAFNIERAAQSWHGKVLCISGPMGLYTTVALRQVLDAWYHQMFLGAQCTYGDDRHLTNCILKKGFNVYYTHKAKCETETPETWDRWIQQQTRWAKSFYREAWYQLFFLHDTSVWTTVEWVYHALYPFMLTGLFLYTCFSFKTGLLIRWGVAMMLLSLLKSLGAWVVTGSFTFILFPLYNVFFLFGMMPCKFAGCITLFFDSGWVTSMRTQPKSRSYVILFPIVWLCVIVIGIVFNILNTQWTITEKILGWVWMGWNVALWVLATLATGLRI